MNVVCDYIFVKLKKDERRIAFIKPLLENLNKSIREDNSVIEVFNLSRLLKQMNKF